MQYPALTVCIYRAAEYVDDKIEDFESIDPPRDIVTSYIYHFKRTNE